MKGAGQNCLSKNNKKIKRGEGGGADITFNANRVLDEAKNLEKVAQLSIEKFISKKIICFESERIELFSLNLKKIL